MLTTNEVLKLAHIRRTALRRWIVEGIVTPREPGSCGRGNTDRFSFGQTMGIIVLGCWQEFLGLSIEQARRHMMGFNTLPDDAFARIVNEWKTTNPTATVERPANQGYRVPDIAIPSDMNSTLGLRLAALFRRSLENRTTPKMKAEARRKTAAAKK